VPKLQSPLASPLGIVTLAGAVSALLTPWTIAIPGVSSSGAFGIQSPIAWLEVAALVGAVTFVRLDLALISLLIAEALLVGWYAWAMWVVTTPVYASQGFPFIGTDIVGPGWYAAGAGLLGAAARVARRYRDSDLNPAAEVWLLSATPGAGLLRVDRMPRALFWGTLVVFLLLIATLGSPLAPLFQPISGFPDLPASPPTRAGTWVPLLLAIVAALASIADTAWTKSRLAK
jgi:hypothetical protein